MKIKNDNMKKYFSLFCILFSMQVIGQDTTINNLLKGMNNQSGTEKLPIKIFNSEKLINANTTELVGKGKMDFRVIHNFYDAAGTNGGIKNFFGLDNAADIKIGFQTGLGRRFDLITSRVRGGENYNTSFSRVQKIWELGFKYRAMEQMENNPKHPLSLAIFANTAVSSMKKPSLTGVLADSAETFFTSFSERMSQAVQVIIARKFRKLSLQLSPTYVHRNRTIPGDDKSIFALGGGARIPLSKNFAFIVDYFHVFHSQSAKDFFKKPGSTIHPVTRFYDPLGVGLEILTAGHVFHLNFTNATEILENRFIPRTVTTWNKGQFRWGFTISRTFVLWREKGK
jgi:hypothetical protein